MLKKLHYLLQNRLLQFIVATILPVTVTWGFIEFLNNYLPETFINSIHVFVFIILVSIIYGVSKTYPRDSIVVVNKKNETRIEFGFSDTVSLSEFDLVIPVNDCFDCFNDKTLVYEFIQEDYDGNSVKFLEDTFINLRENGIDGVIEPTKKFGNNKRFDIGTVAVIESRKRRVYLVVAATINAKKQDKTDSSKLWTAYNSLWSKVKQEGRLNDLLVTVWGRGQTAVSYSRQQLTHLLLSSFILSEADRKITNRIFINTRLEHKGSVDPDYFEDMKRFLSSINYQ